MPASPAEIAKSVRRIRFAELGFGAKDLKAVWHQGIEGFNLLTHVDLAGQAVEHEFVLQGNVIQWRRQQAIRTGRVAQDDDDRGAGPRADVINLDPMPRLEVLEAAAAVAELVTGDDRYLAHFAGVLRAETLPQTWDDTVTGAVVRAPEPDPGRIGLPRLLRRLFG